MSARHRPQSLYYFTVEDESMLAEAFSKFDDDSYAITYKVTGTDDVFVTTHETKEAMDRHDFSYNVLAKEDSSRIALYHTPLSREELGELEEPIKALALAYRAIALACVGVNGETDLGFDLSEGAQQYTYFTAPSGHTFIWRLFFDRQEATNFLSRLTMGDKRALEWADAIPLDSSEDLKSYH